MEHVACKFLTVLRYLPRCLLKKGTDLFPLSLSALISPIPLIKYQQKPFILFPFFFFNEPHTVNLVRAHHHQPGGGQ